MKTFLIITSLLIALTFNLKGQSVSIENCGSFILIKDVPKLKFDFIKKDIITSIRMDFETIDNVKKYYLVFYSSEIFYEKNKGIPQNSTGIPAIQNQSNGIYKYEIDPNYAEPLLLGLKELIR